MLDIKKQVGQRIRHLRLSRGFTQEGLADASGIHRAHLGEIERGDIDPTILTLQKIGHGLKVKVSTLVRGVGARKR